MRCSFYTAWSVRRIVFSFSMMMFVVLTKVVIKMSEEKKLLEIEIDTCDMCHRLGYEVSSLNDEEDLMWLCVGEIIKPENPEDLHKALNEIRLCVVRDSSDDDIICFEWTPYEVSRIAMALTWAVSNHLIKGQPALEDIEALKTSLLTEAKK